MYLILHGAEDQGFPLPVVDKKARTSPLLALRTRAS
jgi:hypothetical protein